MLPKSSGQPLPAQWPYHPNYLTQNPCISHLLHMIYYHTNIFRSPGRRAVTSRRKKGTTLFLQTMIFWISFYSFPNICSHLRIDIVFRQIFLLIEGHFLSLFFFPDGIHLFPNRPLPPIPLGNIAFCTEAVAALSALAIVVTREAPPLARSVDAIRGSHGRKRRHFPEALDPFVPPSVRSLGPKEDDCKTDIS